MDIQKYFNSSIGLWQKDKFEKSYKYIDKNVKWTDVLFFNIVLVIIYIAITMVLELVLNPVLTLSGPFGSITYLLISVLLGVLFYVVLIFIWYGIIHGILKLFKAKGSFLDTLKFGLSITILSMIISLVLDSASTLTSSQFLQGVGASTDVLESLIYFVADLALMIWLFIISAKTYSRLHKVSEGKAWAAMLIPIGIIFLLVIAITFYVVTIWTSMGLY